tara:strand:- start:7435 stop:7914 length:480 start_codon:yes stop_codon:yes gene_type:complete
LIERLEALIEEGQRVPLGKKVLISEREALAIVDQMRISIPEEIREARRILREREQIPQSAQLEAEQIVAKAREQAELIVSDEEIVRQAHARAEQAKVEAEEATLAAREEMDMYALNMLQDIERRLTTHLTSIERAVSALDDGIDEQNDISQPHSEDAST